MAHIFISYSREDQPRARQFAESLERAGFSVWWDQALHPGEAFDQVTERALDEAAAVVVLWSKTSVNSRWVRAIMFELTHPAMAEVRQLPGFKELVTRLRIGNDSASSTTLVEGWRRFGWGDFCRPIRGGDDFECK
jgi:hypothetical protein